MFEYEELKLLLEDGKDVNEILAIKGTTRHHVLKWIKLLNLRPLYEQKITENKRKRFSGEKNPFFGKKHTKKTRNKMVKNHADFNGDNNPFKKAIERNPEIRKAASERKLALWKTRDEEWMNGFRQKLSKSMCESEKNKAATTHKNHKCGFLETKKAGKIFYRSSWEEWVATELDNNENVISFTIEKITIPYLLEGLKKHTRCDFVVEISKKRIMIECKPKYIQKFKNNPQKIQAYMDYCRLNGMEFLLVDEDLVFNSGVFNKIIDGYK